MRATRSSKGLFTIRDDLPCLDSKDQVGYPCLYSMEFYVNMVTVGWSVSFALVSCLDGIPQTPTHSPQMAVDVPQVGTVISFVVCTSRWILITTPDQGGYQSTTKN